MNKAILSLITLTIAAPVFADGTNQLADEKSRASYAIGMSIGSSMKANSIDIDDAMFQKGLQDARNGGPTLLTPEEMRKALTEFQASVRMNAQKRMAEEAAKNKSEGDAFLAANKTKAGVVELPDGLQYQVISSGAGALPQITDTVSVNYSGTLLDGTEFDSSYKRGQPATFPLTGVIKGWTEALQKMPTGSKWKLFIPADLAYGPQGRPGIPPNSTLIFTVELLSIQAPQPQPTAAQPLTSDIIKVPSAEEMKKGAKIEVIKPEDAAKMQSQTNR